MQSVAGNPLDNTTIAERLEEIAELLEAQHANPFRVRAYRRAADVVTGLARPVHRILAEEGSSGLRELAGIGESLAAIIEKLSHSDRVELLERLRGSSEPADRLATVPGIGRDLGRRIHDVLGIEDLYELEIAAYDGRLERVPGFGPGRVRAVRESLAGRFRRGPAMPESVRRRTTDQPSVHELLDLDREYREKVELDELPKIAPRRFNPEGERWLPILHTERGDRHYTVLFSNTARAHALSRTRDWVVIYRDDDDDHGQWTVITSRFGRLRGYRIIRGREAECRKAYGVARRPRKRHGKRSCVPSS